jgi:hypothetical protein
VAMSAAPADIVSFRAREGGKQSAVARKERSRLLIVQPMAHVQIQSNSNYSMYEYPADTHTASLLLYVSTWAILDKKTQG